MKSSKRISFPNGFQRHQYDDDSNPMSPANRSPSKISFPSSSLVSKSSFQSEMSSTSSLTHRLRPAMQSRTGRPPEDNDGIDDDSDIRTADNDDDGVVLPPLTRNPQECYASSPASTSSTRMMAWEDSSFSHPNPPPSMPTEAPSRGQLTAMMCAGEMIPNIHDVMEGDDEKGERSMIAAPASALATVSHNLIRSSLSVVSNGTASDSCCDGASVPRRGSRHVRNRCIMDGNSLSFVSLEADNYVSREFAVQSSPSQQAQQSQSPLGGYRQPQLSRPKAFPTAHFDSVMSEL